MALKPFRGNTQGPVEEFLREVYKWALSVPAQIADAMADIDLSAIEADIAALESDVSGHETRLDDAESDLADHETRIDALESAETAFKTYMFMGTVNQLGTAASTTYYHQVCGLVISGSPVTAIDERQMLWGRAGTIKNLRYQNMDPQVDADTFSWTLNQNGSDTTLTITGISPGSSSVFTDTTHTVTVAVNDKLVFKQVNGGGGLTGNCNPSWCFDFVEA